MKADPHPSLDTPNEYGLTRRRLRAMQNVRVAFKDLSAEDQAIVLPQLVEEHSYYASGGKIDPPFDAVPRSWWMRVARWWTDGRRVSR